MFESLLVGFSAIKRWRPPQEGPLQTPGNKCAGWEDSHVAGGPSQEKVQELWSKFQVEHEQARPLSIYSDGHGNEIPTVPACIQK